MIAEPDPSAADLERRFGASRRLYGEEGYARIRNGVVGVVGRGGGGSWTAEALARSGVAALVLFDLDHVAESNINRQVQALGSTLGQAKVQALAQRIADIHPGCAVHAVEDFVEPGNWPGLLPRSVDVLIDACDQVQSKLTLAEWSLQRQVPLVCVGAAGGKRRGDQVAVDDLCAVTHDPLLASLRRQLRQRGAPRLGPIGVRCVYVREPVHRPADGAREAPAPGSALACAGYGSSVVVTASCGLVAAGEALALLTARGG